MANVRPPGGRKLKPVGGAELWWWYFMRFSGLILVFLALGHLFITHILNNVEVVNYKFVADRWANPNSGLFWRFWDLAMISLAVMHGCNGLREILAEYIASPGRRLLTSTLIWSFAIVLIGLGSYAILFFKKDENYLRRYQAANPEIAGAVNPKPVGSAPKPDQVANAARSLP
ncbi:MAG: hypothetical protein NVSMB14_02650 [Isosphaeraceae bacterium]